MGLDIFNIILTAVCLVALGLYYSFREKKLNKMADLKFLEIREKYLVQIAQRKAKEKAEIEKIRNILFKLENKHKKLISLKPSQIPSESLREAEEIVKRSKQIEEEAKQKAEKYLADQKAEVEERMVDLVMNVTKKVLSKTLTYDDQKELIEQALAEVEGEE